MRFKCKLFLGFIGNLLAIVGFSQDINFSQFYELPLLRNPSLAGIYKGDLRVSSVYRNQWQSVTVPYQTSALSVEIKSGISSSSDDFISFGVQMTNDVSGDSKFGKTQLLPMFTYHKLIYGPTNTYLSAGFLGGPVQQKFDPYALRFDDQFVAGAYSPFNATRQSFTSTNLTYWDAALGLNLSGEIGFSKGYIGAAFYHFTKPRVAFINSNDIRLNRKFVINAGLIAPVSDEDDMIYYGDLFFQGGNRQFQGGAMFMHHFANYGENDDEESGIGFGGFYRWNDAFIPVLKVNWRKFSLGVTYDVNVSALKSASSFRGGVEMSLTYKTYLNILNSSLQKVRCIVPF
jgi:type IX secretion system PorP/SprF family membrane protein